MVAAYGRLHALGHAHSVEIWSGQTLAGGLYGVAVGRVFFAESMFSRMPSASKAALVFIARELIERDFLVMDCQLPSRHLATMGAREIPRREFLALLAAGIHSRHEAAGHWPAARRPVSAPPPRG
jgi:leucyl/phenylalanyl-tRNA---protein transferase